MRAQTANTIRRHLPRTRAQERRGYEDVTRGLLLGAVVPAWIGAGFADWWLHRRSDIEHTAGTRESAIHGLMMAEAGVPLLLGLFRQVNAGLLSTALAGLAAHQATAVWDVSYAEARREVTTTEQHVHGMLEMVPMSGVALIAALHWDQTLSLVGRGPLRPDFRLLPKDRPLSRRSRAAVLVGVGLFGALPYAEELWRCWRVDHTLRARPEAPQSVVIVESVPSDEQVPSDEPVASEVTAPRSSTPETPETPEPARRGAARRGLRSRGPASGEPAGDQPVRREPRAWERSNGRTGGASGTW